MDDEKYIGYLKYKGKSVDDGLLDARKAAKALLGFDEAVRFFACQQSKKLQEVDFEIPIRVKRGSWEALIPTDIIGWIIAAGGVGVASYVGNAAKEMAKNDFGEKKLKDIFEHSLTAIQWMVRIGKHLGNVTKKHFENTKFRNDNTEVGIPNKEGEHLYVPMKYFKLYVAADYKLLKNVTELIEEERELELGVFKEGELTQEKISYREKYIFTSEDEDTEDILFPELEHGKSVELTGHVTRGNEKANTLGFEYKGYILTCEPMDGTVVRFKKFIFSHCIVSGSISRENKEGGCTEQKPRIKVSRIEYSSKSKKDTLF